MDVAENGLVAFPEHKLRHVTVPAGRSIGLQLMTVSNRPVVQAVTSTQLRRQGLAPCDVLVTIDGVHVGDVGAVGARRSVTTGLTLTLTLALTLTLTLTLALTLTLTLTLTLALTLALTLTLTLALTLILTLTLTR